MNQKANVCKTEMKYPNWGKILIDSICENVNVKVADSWTVVAVYSTVENCF